MRLSLFPLLLLSNLCSIASGTPAAVPSSSFYNPILPGWHSDPSCTVVDDTFYCVSSTFISFPGLPIYASKDLLNWKLIGHVWNRDSQLPGVSWNTKTQQAGMYAATIRHHDGVFYVVCEYVNGEPDGTNLGVLFKTANPFDETTWSNPVTFPSQGIDCDLFWHEDGNLYVAIDGIRMFTLDPDTGAMSTPVGIWNGTGWRNPEGPHIYLKDSWYYLMIAEGGTETNHSVTIARSKDIMGPYESYANNPILTNRFTDEYFQTVGHADLFQDRSGNWWGVALSTRSGPDWKIYPMGRETVLYNVTWEEGQWPALQPVRGPMSGWPLPAKNLDIPGTGPFNNDPDVYDFTSGPIPRNLIYWRVPINNTFTVTKGGLQVVPSRNNLTGAAAPIELTGQRGLAFIGRRQTHTLFDYSVDLASRPQQVNEEAGVTFFLTQYNHIDLSVVLLPSTSASSHQDDAQSQLYLRLQVEAANISPAPPATLVPVPEAWGNGPITLHIQAANDTHFVFSASEAANPTNAVTLGAEPAIDVSGGTGPFTGGLLGVFATCNGAGSGTACPAGGEVLFQHWRYTGKAQQVSATEFIPV